MRARALCLAALLPLVACGKQDDGPGAPRIAATPMSNALLDPATEMARRWTTVFADRGKRIAAAADLGYTIGPLQPAAGTPAFATASPEQVIRIERSPVKIHSTLVASGAKASLVDRYVFVFDGRGDDGHDTKAASAVDKTPLRVLLGFLQRFEVQPTDQIKVAIKEFRPIEIALPGATIGFVPGTLANPRLKRNRRSVLTITRPGAAAPTAAQDTATRK